MSNAAPADAIGHYLLDALHTAGARHVFGVPGDYILRFYQEMTRGPIIHIGTTREDTAAFAADGYARCRGIGALAVTYGVGALNVVNAIAGAYAEYSPVVVISGAPGVQEQRDDPLLHHRFGPFTFQREIFDRITCASTVLDDPVTAFRQIDRTLHAAQVNRRPVYIELPRDQVLVPGHAIPGSDDLRETDCDKGALLEAVKETCDLLSQCRSPVIVAGVEVHRRGLQDVLAELVGKARLPIAATLTGKSVFPERHPAYLGVYEGAMSNESVRHLVEQSDLLLLLGMTLNDVDTGIYTAKLDPALMVRASQGEVIIRHHRYPRVPLEDFLKALSTAALPKSRTRWEPSPGPSAPDFPISNQPMRIGRLIGRLNQALTPNMMVIADTGDCLFAGLDLRVHERSQFFACAYYTSMGFAVPVALGAQIARPDARALVLVGDGAFQMTGTELSTHAHLGLNPIVIVFNNKGYSTERFLLDGPFNDISPWQFDRLGEVFGPMRGYDVHTEEEFEAALQLALDTQGEPSLLNVHLPPDEPSPAMRRLTEHMGQRISG